jgi:hypothetical protein
MQKKSFDRDAARRRVILDAARDSVTRVSDPEGL